MIVADICGHVIGAGHAVADFIAGEGGKKLPHPRIVGTGEKPAVLGQQADELLEGSLDIFDGFVIVQVVVVDVVDNGDGGVLGEEAAHILAGLCNE